MTNKKTKIITFSVFIALFIALAVWYLSRHNIGVFNPAGQIAHKERNLIFVALLLSAIVVIPVYIMAISITLRYREDSKKPRHYTPDWDHSPVIEGFWWGIPGAIILVLSVITWNSSHALDPYKPISSTVPAMNVQVVALDWKWLFIYPSQHMASVNLLELPVGTPINFQITSDTVMNSFWIPNLGSQIYAMPGMDTELHLIADKAGNFPGSSANISGSGFASMAFTAQATSMANFQTWVGRAQKTSQPLNAASYNQLASPSQDNPTTTYSQADPNLFNGVIDKYMVPGMSTSNLEPSAAAAQNSPNMGMEMR